MCSAKTNVYIANTLHNHIKRMFIVIKIISINCNPNEFAKEQKKRMMGTINDITIYIYMLVKF